MIRRPYILCLHFLACAALTRFHVASHGDVNSAGEVCADLNNADTHFAVNVKLGTPVNGEPPQTFNLLADTGSDSLVVTSCICRDKGLCDEEDQCFRGSNHSSTFDIMKVPQLLSRSNLGRAKPEPGPVAVRMTFGSGSVTSVVASDVVELAGLKAKMKDGLLLMVDRSELGIDGPFEGILGLGPPADAARRKTNANKEPNRVEAYRPTTFLEEAGVERFSICFNDASKPGALRMNGPYLDHPLPNIGNFHWGVGLFGIHTGNPGNDGQVPALFCEANTMKPEQESPCGAIPDSGTTLLMGPEEQVMKIFEDLCNNWHRCRTATSGNMQGQSKADAFQNLLYQCGDWITNEYGIDEVPSVHLTLGSPGNLQRVELTAWSYIVELDEEIYKHNFKYLTGLTPFDVPEATGKVKKVCVPSFGIQNYKTVENGPVWTLGAPLFHQYTVGYGMKDGGTLSFLRQECHQCNEADAPGAKASFLSSQQKVVKRARRTRTMKTPPRMPNFDKSRPL